MKFIRILLFCVVGLAVLLAAVVALAFHSGMQTWAVRRAIATRPDLNLSIGSVNAGLNVTRVESIHLIQPGLDLTVPAAEVEVSLVDAASSRVAVKRVVAKGWTLDLGKPVTTTAGTASVPAGSVSPANATPSPSPATENVRQAFAGIFKRLKLPVDFSLDGLDMEGDVILPAGQGTLHVVITGGNIGVGQDGKIVFKAVLSPAQKGAPAGTLVVQSDIIVRMDTPRSFEHLAVTTNATATGGRLPKGTDVHVAVDAVRGAKGEEAYSVVLRTGQKELVNFTAKLPEGTAPLTGAWALDVHDTDVAPFTLGRTLPTFSAAGQGTISADREFAEIHAAGKLNATVDGLAALSPEFSAIGRMNFTADFDVTRQGDYIRIDHFSSQVAGVNPVIGIETRQIMKFNPATHALEAARPADDLFLISVQGLPLAWARPFLPGFDITGDDVKGEFAASARDGGFAVRPLAPLTLSRLNVSQGGKPLVSALDIGLSVGGDYTPKGWQAELSNLSVVSGVTTLFKLGAKAGQLAGVGQPIKAAATFEADLPGLLDQPAAPAGLSLSDGVARGDITASLADKQEIAVTLQLANLVGKTHDPMPAVALYVRADRAANGRIDVQAPLVITQAGRKSDLTLGAVVQPAKTGLQIDAQMKSDALYVEDLKRFAGLVPPAQPAPTAPDAPNSSGEKPSVRVPASSGPLWSGVSGELKLDLKKIVYSSAFQVTDIGGAVKITPEAISLDTLRAALGGEASLKAGGSLSYDAKQASEPYGLKADLAVTNFDPAPMLRSLDSLKPAPVEGKFDLTTRLDGRALDPAGFKDTALGDVKLISRGGTLRVLGVKAGNTANNVSKAAAVVGLIGAFTGNSTASKYAERGQAGADVVKQLGTIKFDQLNVVVERDAQRNLVIKEITLISPGIRLAGSGKIAYMQGVPLVQQPLAINLQLGARDRLAANLRMLRLLGTGAGDELGYLPLVEPIKLDGTLQSIGKSQLEHLINRAITD